MGDSGDYWNERAAYRERQKRKMVRCDGCGKSILRDEQQCPFCHMRQGSDDEETT